MDMKPIVIIDGKWVPVFLVELCACVAECIPRGGHREYKPTGEYYTNVWRTRHSKVETYAGKPVRAKRPSGRSVLYLTGPAT